MYDWVMATSKTKKPLAKKKPAAKKPVAKKPAAKKAVAKKPAAKKAIAKKPAAKKPAAKKKAVAKKPAAKKAVTKKPAAKKAVAKKPAAKKAAPKKPAAKKSVAKKAAPKKAIARRDATGHLDAKYARDLRKKGGHEEKAGRAFFSRSRSGDDLAEELGEEAVATMTSGEDSSERLLDGEVEEEVGGPFVITSSRNEMAGGRDASNPRGATREPFPRTRNV